MDAKEALQALKDRRKEADQADDVAQLAKQAAEQALLDYSNSVEGVVRSLLPALTWERPRGSRRKEDLIARVTDGPLKSIIDNVLGDSWYSHIHFGDLSVSVRHEHSPKGDYVVVEMPVKVLNGLGVKIIRKSSQEKKQVLKLLEESGLDSDGLAELLRKRKHI